jgi:hypothetical protein
MSYNYSDSDQDTYCSEAEIKEYQSEEGSEEEEPRVDDMEYDYINKIGVRCLKYIMIAHTTVVIGLFLSLFWS